MMSVIAVASAQCLVSALMLVPNIAQTKTAPAFVLAIGLIILGMGLLAQSQGIIHIELWTL